MAIKTFKNQKGVTLIEILIAMAIFSISLFTIMEFARGTQASLTSVSRQLTYDVIKMNVGAVLTRASDCSKAIKNSGAKFVYNGAETHLSQIELDGDVLAQANTVVDGILMKDIIVRPVPGVAVKQSGYQKYHLAELILKAEKQGDVMGYRELSNENNPFRIYVITNQNNEMISCSSAGVLEATQTCNNSGLTPIRTKVENGETYEVYNMGWTKGFRSGVPPELAKSPTAKDVCGEAPEGRFLALECPVGKVFSRVVFASFGTGAKGSCKAGFTKGSCHAKASADGAIAPCYGKDKCSIDVAKTNFGADPCPGTAKSLTVQMECDDVTMVQYPENYMPDPSNPDAPIPTPLPTPQPTGVAVRCVTKQGEQFGTLAICIAGKPCYWE